MPELPEVETIRRMIEPRVRDAGVGAVLLRRPDVARHLDDRLRPRRLAGAALRRALLEAQSVAAVRRHGKQLALVADSGRVLIVQLGMSGRLLLATGPERSRHAHCEWALRDGGAMVFEDARRFGGLTTLPSEESLAAHWAALGPDALGIEGGALRAALGRSRRWIKGALLDQGAIAGVGNIYADEALFRASISPRRRCDRLPADAWDRLAGAIREVLAQAVRAGGSTVRDYRDAAGEPGRHQESHAVYGRAGRDCVRCGGKLRGTVVAQRTTVWCPACQKG